MHDCLCMWTCVAEKPLCAIILHIVYRQKLIWTPTYNRLLNFDTSTSVATSRRNSRPLPAQQTFTSAAIP
ncbi:unnamed protein product, partial [Iphiclides podalirius]